MLPYQNMKREDDVDRENRKKPRIAITMGDVNGIGPEILTKALAQSELRDACDPVVFGSAGAFDRARRYAPSCPRPMSIASLDAKLPSTQGIALYDANVPEPPITPGRVAASAGRCAVTWLEHAVQAAMEGHVDAVVTCPINKEGLRLAGCTEIGHTEIIARLTRAPDYRMSLFAGAMRIVHISSHCSLADALRLVHADRIAMTIRVAHDALTQLHLGSRRIAVAGLNPHAGENGLLGDDESHEIAPAVRRCRAEGIDCSGPYPPDTVFRRMREGEFDLVVAMYHDQGHIPLKLIAMDEGVNVTLGIPIVRTSVDHGTAYDIAWTGRAREHSLCAAIRLAVEFCSHGVGKGATIR